MIDRRSFLIGAGALLTTCFVHKADWYLDNKQTVVPLINQNKSLEKLYFVPISSSEYEVRLGTPDLSYESFRQLTYREMLDHYRGVSEPKTLSDFRDIYHDWGITPRMLDQIADPMDYVDDWGRIDSPKAQAYHYLEKLDLFGSDQLGGLRRGDLQFVDGACPGNDYLAVVSDDPLSASLLQARLLELGQKTSVELIDEG